MTFTPEPDVWTILEPLDERSGRPELLNAAVRAHHNPPFELIIPRLLTLDDSSIVTLGRLIENARREVVFVESSLWDLYDVWRDALKCRADEGLVMTFMTIRSSLQPDNSLYRVLQDQLSGTEHVNQLLDRIRTATSFFRELAAEHEQVHLLGLNEVPFAGLTIVDPPTNPSSMAVDPPSASSRIRVDLFSSPIHSRHNSFFEISRRNSEGVLAFAALYAYYQELQERSVIGG